MLADRLRRVLSPSARLHRAWFFAASVCVNLPLFWILSSIGSAPRQQAALTFIPVTMVELPPSRPEPEDAVKPEPPADAAPPQPRMSAPDIPRAPEAGTVRSPVIAAAGETADAALPDEPETDPADPEFEPPTLPDPAAPAIAALRSLNCNRLGRDRPASCDENADPLAPPGPDMAELADADEMRSFEWSGFERAVPDADLQGLLEQRCPPRGGVIKEVFTASNGGYTGPSGMSSTIAPTSADSVCE